MKSTNRPRVGRLLAGAAPLALSLAALSSPAFAIVPNDNVTSDEAVDTDDEFSGVGMFFRADGFVCTGTLINPRTVLFAAHCVNDVPETVYNKDNLPAAFSFNVNALPGFQNWLTNNFASNPDLAVYNINRLYWNSQSNERPDSLGFLEGDIAIASLDTPAAGIPTWSLLFSPLPTPDAITDADGTGYHVNITGYGATGSGTAGPNLGIDFRRRSAENMLGALASFDQRNTFLFGDPLGDLPQALYRLDFDDPNMTNPFDFNLYKDEARVNEGTTAGGDSGGPLILDAANNTLSDEDLVIGVLSGGSRFFGGQGFSSYGTESFYQPLYLYWDYIAANNPYRYVTAAAGDGNWEDGTHWLTTLDPVYKVIDASGNVVNGLPTSPGNGRFGTDPVFGEICFDPQGDNPGEGCEDLATGDQTPPARNIAGGTLTSNIGTSNIGIVDGIAISGVDGEGLRNGMLFSLEAQAAGPDFAEESPNGASGGSPEFSDDPLPAPTLANGLPGATNFVPDNVDPIIDADPALDVAPRYFDVTLGAAGTTSLNSAATIDRLTVRNSAGLYIGADGDLTSLIDVSQFGGSVNIDGNLTSAGDYTLFAGFLGGNGVLTAPFLTNIMGAISPGGTGTVGTFTIDGNAVLSSGSTLLIDFGPGGTSDRLDITGEVSIDGVVALGGGITQTVNGDGTQYTILTADSGIVDGNGDAISTFTNGTISAILSQNFTYEANAVLLEIMAASYTTAIDGTDPVQSAYAQLFDQNRPNSALSALYGLDFAAAETIQNTFVGLAPVTETAVRTLAAQSYNDLMNFNNNRLAVSNRESMGGTIATLGDPLKATQVGLSRYSQPLSINDLGLADSEEVTNVQQGALPDNLAIYFAGGLVNGSGASMPGYQQTKTQYDGYILAGGIELFPGDNTVVGASVYHSNLDADVVLGGSAESTMWAGSIYGRTKTAAGIVLDGQVSVSKFETDTSRTVSFLGAPQTLVSNDDSTGISAGLGVSYDMDFDGTTISPGVEARYSNVSFDVIGETGGVTALQIDRENYKSFQGRAGIDFQSAIFDGVQVTGNADYVHEFENGPQLFQANFVGGTGPTAGFALDGTDQNWFEVGMGVSVEKGPVKLGVGASTTIGRDDASARTYSANATLRF